MARKQRAEDPPPSKAYLVSFGDTMTTLLAFFIVLCSLAEEQTGANLYRGTGSFVAAMQGQGLPGPFSSPTTANAIERHDTSPLYVAPDPDNNPPAANPTGPDENDNGLRSIDREAEVFQRFLNELEQLSKVEQMPETKGEVVFDFFNPLPKEGPLLTKAYQQAFLRVLPILRRPTYRVDVVVWATTPNPTAWLRAANQATAITEELTALAGLTAEQRSRLNTIGKPWRYSDVKRPVLSIIVRRIDGRSYTIGTAIIQPRILARVMY